MFVKCCLHARGWVNRTQHGVAPLWLQLTAATACLSESSPPQAKSYTHFPSNCLLSFFPPLIHPSIFSQLYSLCDLATAHNLSASHWPHTHTHTHTHTNTLMWGNTNRCTLTEALISHMHTHTHTHTHTHLQWPDHPSRGDAECSCLSFALLSSLQVNRRWREEGGVVDREVEKFLLSSVFFASTNDKQ